MFNKVKKAICAVLTLCLLTCSISAGAVNSDSAGDFGTPQVQWTKFGFTGIINQFSGGGSWTQLRTFSGRTHYLIDVQGNIVYQDQNDTILGYVPFTEGLTVTQSQGPAPGWDIVDTGLRTITTVQADSASYFSDGLLVVSRDGKYGAVNRNGTLMIPFDYDGLYDFVDGYSWAKQGDMWSIIDKEENLTEVPNVASVSPFSDGLSCVWQNHKWGAVDTSGKFVIQPMYDSLQAFSDGVTVAKLGEGFILLDKAGNTVAELDYDSVSGFAEGRALVSKDGKYGFIDMAGKLVINLDYDVGNSYQDAFGRESWGWFCGGLASMNRNGKYGMIDTTGKTVVPFEYDYIGPYGGEGAVWVGMNGGNGTVDKYGILTFSKGESQPGQAAASDVAYATSSPILVDGVKVDFQTYGLKDGNGDITNYVKLRDIASAVNGTAAQFEVVYDGSIGMETGKPYTPNGSEMQTPFSGDRAYRVNTAPVKVNGVAADLSAIILTDDSGGGFTYFKLRDIGKALGFNVSWDSSAGSIVINTDEPYDDN